MIEYIKYEDAIRVISNLQTMKNAREKGKAIKAWASARKKINALQRIIRNQIEYIRLDETLNIINNLPTLHNTIEGGRMFESWDEAQKKIQHIKRIEVKE